MVTLLAAALALASAAPQPAGTPQAARVRCEFRVFDGSDEVSSSTRVRIYDKGQRDNAIAPDASGHVDLAPGVYDVQAVRERDGQVAGIRWLTGLLIQRYPDENGSHLEVLNFKPQYGALELRTGDADLDAAAFRAGDRTRPVATGLRGQGYLLLVLPAGRYDVSVRAKAPNGSERWLPDVDVPVDRTRLRTLQPGAAAFQAPSGAARAR
jgi:hypothetical protein